MLYGRVMPCVVVFGATNEVRHYVVLKKAAAEVATALERARDEFGQFEDENGETLWISARNVWYIEDGPLPRLRDPHPLRPGEA